MGIFKRIVRIARSEINARFRRDPKSSAKGADQEIPEDFEIPKSSGGSHSGGQRQQSHAQSGGQQGSSRDRQVEEWYAILELPNGSDMDKVQKAWKELLRKYHPDKHIRDPEQARIANEVTQQLNQAYKGLQKHLKKS